MHQPSMNHPSIIHQSSNKYPSFINHPSIIHQPPINHLSTILQPSIDHPSTIHPAAIQSSSSHSLNPSKINRKSDLLLSIENLEKINRKHISITPQQFSDLFSTFENLIFSHIFFKPLGVRCPSKPGKN